jgi:hypothetical protein
MAWRVAREFAVPFFIRCFKARIVALYFAIAISIRLSFVLSFTGFP